MNEELFQPTLAEAAFYGIFWTVVTVIVCGFIGMMIKQIQIANKKRKVSLSGSSRKHSVVK